MDDNRRLTLKNLPDVFVILKWMLIMGIVFIISLSWVYYDKSHISGLFFKIGNASLIAGAFYGLGGLTGFLFGIPKIIQSSVSDTNNNNNSDIVHNDNLVQISDWLTKIIVGVGLTQLYNIPKALHHVGEKLGTSILGYDPKNDMGTNASVAIILYFSVLGFMMVYIWTRLYFYDILKEADAKFKQMYKETKVQLENVIIEKKEMEAEKDAIISTFPDVTQEIKEKQINIRNDDNVENDPNKGKFGGLHENYGRKIAAVVRETSYDKELFVVDLEVTSTNEAKPLTGEVTFHLHPSFKNEKEIIKVINGKAENKLISYGAFTVGVEADNGATRLELDLAELPDAPRIFRER